MQGFAIHFKDFKFYSKCIGKAGRVFSNRPTSNVCFKKSTLAAVNGLKKKKEVLGDQERRYWDFPGSPVVKTLCSQCRGHGFNPWLGN